MSCFINLPLRWVLQDENWLHWFLAGHIEPELGLDEQALAQPESWHREIAAAFHDAGLACSVHLPFMGLKPGAQDQYTRQYSEHTLARAVKIALIYKARHMIGHPGFSPEKDYRADAPDLPGLSWLEAASEAWGQVADMSAIPLYLENIYDPSPRVVVDLVSRIRRPHVGICFDIGHWFHFSGGCVKDDLPDWILTFAPHLRHLHLHDNDGSADQHLGLGQGSIPVHSIVGRLQACGLSPTATCEPHSFTDYRHTAVWMRQHPEAARFFAWQDARPVDFPPPAELF